MTSIGWTSESKTLSSLESGTWSRHAFFWKKNPKNQIFTLGSQDYVCLRKGTKNNCIEEPEMNNPDGLELILVHVPSPINVGLWFELSKERIQRVPI